MYISFRSNTRHFVYFIFFEGECLVWFGFGKGERKLWGSLNSIAASLLFTEKFLFVCAVLVRCFGLPMAPDSLGLHYVVLALS